MDTPARMSAETIARITAEAAQMTIAVGGQTLRPVVTWLDDEALACRLATFEQRYGMSSAEFLRRYNAGEYDGPEADPDLAFVEWAGLLALAARAGMNVPERA